MRFIFLCFVLLVSAGFNEAKRTRVISKWRLTAIANKLFAHRLFMEVARTTPEQENFFISPYAVSAGLSMTLYGAHSTTAREIMDTLGYTQLSTSGNFNQAKVPRLYQKMLHQVHQKDHGFELTSVNRMFGESRNIFVPSYVKGVEHFYGAKLKKVPFRRNPERARQEINTWVEEVTNGTIREALPPNSVTAETLLVLMSTLYFKGLWEKPFEINLRSTFYTTNNEQYQTDFVQQTMFALHSFSEQFQAHIVELPFKTSSSRYKMVMQLILPESRGADNLNLIEDQFDEENFDFATEDQENISVTIRLPKFRLEYETDLKETLYNMGIQSLFSRGEADLSGISTNGDLSLGSAHHKTFIQVDESGTTAGASYAQGGFRSVSDLDLVFNHPFIVIIREKYTQMPMFMGRVARPMY
uniref:serpin B3 n=1 Tax=Ciona intestinalis TaxID=7719 RepID=UPI000180BA7A|nr:serpin B3 [Ciona intestinalis]|eukprot:XP_002130310.1 serpin B3 [Ciona intestinalis]